MAKDTEAPTEGDPLIAKATAKEGAFPGLGFGPERWLMDLEAKAGFELLAILFVVQHLHRGFVDSVTSQSSNYVYRLYHVPATSIQIYSGLATLPWALKPMVGLVSDIFPIGGYNKAPYMLIVSLLGCAAYACVGVMPSSVLPITGVVACFFLQSLQLSANDILTEAKYAAKIRETPEIGPGLLTYVWFGMNVAGLLGTLVAGALAADHAKMPYSIAAVMSILIFYPLMLGYMQEKRVTDEELQASRRRFAQEGEACFLSFMMFVAVVSLTLCGLITHNPTINGFMAIGMTTLIILAASLVLSPVIAKFAVFSTLQSALTVSTSGAGFYFFVDTPEQFPEGPHFSEFFFTSVLGVCSTVMSLVGIACYQRYMSTWRYRPLVMVGNLVFSLVCILDLVMYTRLNVRLGIPDHLFVFSTNVLQQVIFQWQWMPQVVILSYLCPPGMEATMYALLAGCHNLGVSVSSTTGSFLLKLLHCEPNGSPNESGQFKNLWIASLISVVLPLITVFVLINLVPDARQGERVIEDSERSATAGSLWRRWRGEGDTPHPKV